MLGERARAAECARKVASVSRPSRSGTRKGSRAVPGAPFQGLLMMEVFSDTLSLLGGCRREVKKRAKRESHFLGLETVRISTQRLFANPSDKLSRSHFPICGANRKTNYPHQSSISSKIAVSVWFLVGRKPWNIESPRRVNFAAVRDGAFG